MVHRTDAFPQNRISFDFPVDVDARDATRVHATARALCDLPAVPAGPIACPADYEIAYP